MSPELTETHKEPRSFEKVTVPRGGRGIGRKVRLRALREHMARFNVPCEERAL